VVVHRLFKDAAIRVEQGCFAVMVAIGCDARSQIGGLRQFAAANP
jgi:hypothetical protein